MRSPDRGHCRMWWDSSANPRENIDGSNSRHVVETHTAGGGDGGRVQHEGMRAPGASKRGSEVAYSGGRGGIRSSESALKGRTVPRREGG
ncbi:unnamed protein product [Calypogeia fissa]